MRPLPACKILDFGPLSLKFREISRAARATEVSNKISRNSQPGLASERFARTRRAGRAAIAAPRPLVTARNALQRDPGRHRSLPPRRHSQLVSGLVAEQPPQKSKSISRWVMKRLKVGLQLFPKARRAFSENPGRGA